MGETAFQQYSAYYDLLYRDKDYGAEVDYIVRTLRSVMPEVHRLLEFGSGTGRHGRLLAAQGFDVFGIERSGDMVAEAQRKAASRSQNHVGFDCRQGDIKTVDLREVFDAVLSLFHVVSYQTCNADLIATFNSAARHLDEGGIFFSMSGMDLQCSGSGQVYALSALRTKTPDLRASLSRSSILMPESSPLITQSSRSRSATLS